MNIRNIARIVSLTIKIRSRDKLDFFWNLIFPAIVFIGWTGSRQIRNDNQDQLLRSVLPICVWMIFQSSFFWVGLGLVAYREDRVLKSFVQQRKCLFNLIVGLVSHQSLVSLFYSAAILFCAFMFAGLHSIPILHVIFGVILVSVLASLLSLLFTHIPMTESNLTTLLNLFIWLMASSAISGSKFRDFSEINSATSVLDIAQFFVLKFNPISILSDLLDFMIQSTPVYGFYGHLFLQLMGLSLVAAGAFWLTLSRFSVLPMVQR